jgi:hypothetical protein
MFRCMESCAARSYRPTDRLTGRPPDLAHRGIRSWVPLRGKRPEMNAVDAQP